METKYKNLSKWEGTLASCIRCGYCFEHCPLFKHTEWESDAPRAKIITAFGLLSGNIEPSDNVADKMFSCFYCKRCEAACSSGVKLTDVFTDAKKDLKALGYEEHGTVSVTHLNCARCLICIGECPHDARSYDGDKIYSDPALCQSCGRCVEVCPAGAAKINDNFGTGRKELETKIERFFAEGESSKAIVFACNWSYYPDLQASVLPESETKDDDYKILVNMCGGRLETQLLMTPFLNKAWGVLVAVCPEGECDHDGNIKAKKRVEKLKKILEKVDIDPQRVSLVEIPAGDKQEFQAQIDTFIDNLNNMGPIS